MLIPPLHHTLALLLHAHTALAPYPDTGAHPACVYIVIDTFSSFTVVKLIPKCAGKEGFPSIAYQMHSVHSGYIIHVSPGVYGACNDKTIVRFDSFVQALRSGKKYTNTAFTLLALVVGAVVQVTRTGVYAICDGGYHMWKATMSALKLDSR